MIKISKLNTISDEPTVLFDAVSFKKGTHLLF